MPECNPHQYQITVGTAGAFCRMCGKAAGMEGVIPFEDRSPAFTIELRGIFASHEVVALKAFGEILRDSESEATSFGGGLVMAAAEILEELGEEVVTAAWARVKAKATRST